jgi:GSH-dependent disulfide-bond oxidoreductase
MIDLYYAPTPNGWKISIMLEELGLPYRVIPVNIRAGEQFKPEFLAISPNNRIPAIIDRAPSDGGEPFSVFETGAILIYLAEKTGCFWPADLRGRSKVVQWVMWQMGGLGPMLGQPLRLRQGACDGGWKQHDGLPDGSG